MIKLSDTQRILLSSAAQRETGSLLPLPSTLKAGGGTAKAITALIARGFVEERETSDKEAMGRTDGDINYGVFILPAGNAAIGFDDDVDTAEGPVPAPVPTERASSRPPSKTAAIIALLARTNGATLPELIEATSWLPHTTRAALTGLRKKGHDIIRSKRDGATCYRIVEAA